MTRLCCLLLVLLMSCAPVPKLDYDAQIEKSLQPFRNAKISREELWQSYKAQPHSRAYIEIQNGRLGPVKTASVNIKAEMIRKILEDVIAEYGPLPDMALVFNLEDGLQMPLSDAAYMRITPIFSFQASDKFADIAFPFAMVFHDIDDSYKSMRSFSTPWESKIDAVVWRGSQTGGHYDEKNWKSYARSKLVLKSKDEPDYVDAGFVYFTQVSPEAQEAIAREVGLKSRVSMEEMQRWKYIASLDGNGWADRFVKLLSSSSAVFKQDSSYYEFFYSALRPYEHYIPIAKDLSDIKAQVEWARANPEKVKAIVASANRFIDTQMHQTHVNAYVHKLLVAYAELMR